MMTEFIYKRLHMIQRPLLTTPPNQPHTLPPKKTLKPLRWFHLINLVDFPELLGS